jgi:hypothetical protein
MTDYIIPKNAGPYRIVNSRAGSALVMNDRNGKNKVRIPCKSMKQAERLCRQLNKDEHNGVVHA